MTVADGAQMWAEGYLRVAPLRDATKRNKWERVRCYIIPRLGALDFAAIDDMVLQDWIAYLSSSGRCLTGEGLAPISVRKIYNQYLEIQNWLMDRGAIAHAAGYHVALPKGGCQEAQIFSAEEVAGLIRVVRPKWMGPVIEIAYRTGMRRGEIFGLQWRDINWTAETIMVQRAVTAMRSGEREVTPPKTYTSCRCIPIDRHCIDLLRMLQATARSEWVIVDQYGRPISPWYTVRYMHAACDALGIPHRGLHALRHTHATTCLAAAPAKVVQDRLGHAWLSQTITTYNHAIHVPQDNIVAAYNDIVVADHTPEDMPPEPEGDPLLE